MLSKNELKNLIKYKQDKYRKQDDLFVVEGVKLAEELLKSDFEILAVYATRLWIDENQDLIKQNQTSNPKSANNISVNYDKDTTLAKTRFTETNSRTVKSFSRNKKSDSRVGEAEQSIDKTFPINEITEEELAKISLLSTPNKVYCLARRQKNTMSFAENGLSIVLDGIKDPGNLGTIVRLADWYAIDRVICSKDSVDIYNPKTVQSTMGSIFRVNVSYENLTEFFESLPQDYPIYGSLVECGENIYREQLTENAILVIGSESHGISPQIRKYITHKVNIPRFKQGNAPESLNAAIATAIMISEFKRTVL